MIIYPVVQLVIDGLMLFFKQHLYIFAGLFLSFSFIIS